MSGRAHIFVLLLAIGLVGFVLRLVRRRQMRAKYSFIWLGLGLGALVLAVVPGLLDRTASAVGVDYAPALLFMLAILVLLLVVVHFSWELSRLEERVRTLAEYIALVTAEKAESPSPGDNVGEPR
ncbi:MAG TPA: DUF2304 domain-containing protein [Acidimicrobiales bacterium]|nr:DUF2304 domain-containing protein [Acidimicrobiales bacterium]